MTRATSSDDLIFAFAEDSEFELHMSFHFQPQADSSDEEDAVNISAWKSGAPKSAQRPLLSPPTAAIEIMDEIVEAINNEDEDEDDTAVFEGDLNNRAEQSEDDKVDGEVEEKDKPDTIAVPAFTPVNKSTRSQAPISLSESSEAELGFPENIKMQLPTRARNQTGRSTSGSSRTQKKAARVLVPVIPRLELDSSEAEEIIDFTAGSDVVRRVKREINAKYGDVVYQVEFEDRHVEEVSQFPFSSSTSTGCVVTSTPF